MAQPYYGLTALTTPALPMTLDEFKGHLRLDGDDTQDSEATAKLRYAAEEIEAKTGHVAKSTQYRVVYARFPMSPGNRYYVNGYASGVFELPRWPIITVDSIQYYNTDGTLTTLDSAEYQVSTDRTPGTIMPARLKFWPITDPYTLDSVQVTFTAGYTTPPHRYVEAIKFLAAYRFFNRESDAESKLPDSLKSLIRSLKSGDQ